MKQRKPMAAQRPVNNSQEKNLEAVMITITNRGNMWHILKDGVTVGFATTYVLARAKAGLL